MNTTEKKTKILIVEDEKEIRDMYSRKLVEAGYIVIVADDGTSGIAQALQHQPDLILADVNMPHMSGFEMLKQLRAKNEWGANVRTIFLTNIEPSTEAANSAIEATGPAYYLLKSRTDPSELISKIHEVLES